MGWKGKGLLWIGVEGRGLRWGEGVSKGTVVDESGREGGCVVGEAKREGEGGI